MWVGRQVWCSSLFYPHSSLTHSAGSAETAVHSGPCTLKRDSNPFFTPTLLPRYACSTTSSTRTSSARRPRPTCPLHTYWGPLHLPSGSPLTQRWRLRLWTQPPGTAGSTWVAACLPASLWTVSRAAALQCVRPSAAPVACVGPVERLPETTFGSGVTKSPYPITNPSHTTFTDSRHFFARAPLPSSLRLCASGIPEQLQHSVLCGTAGVFRRWGGAGQWVRGTRAPPGGRNGAVALRLRDIL